MTQRQLSQEAISIAQPYGKRVHYRERQQIHARGALKPGLTIVLSGQVRVGNYGVDGRYYQTTILQGGDVIGESTIFAGLPRTHCAEAMAQTEVLQINVAQVEKLLVESPRFNRALMTCLAVKLHVALEMVDDLMRHSTAVRLAKLLYQLGQKTGFVVKLSQQDCAQLLGVSLLSAHHAMHALAAQELLVAGYGRIEIAQPEQLRNWLEHHLSLLPLT